MKSDQNKWEKGEFLFFKGSGWCYPENNKPHENCFYTKDEAIAFEKLSRYAPSEDFDWNDEKAVMDMLHNNEWFDYDYFWDYFCEEFDTFKESLTTPNGEEIISFGYYGYW